MTTTEVQNPHTPRRGGNARKSTCTGCGQKITRTYVSPWFVLDFERTIEENRECKP